MGRPSVKLLVDENVTGLARWLRFAGFDTVAVPDGIPDTEVFRRALDEERILITRDADLASRLPPGQAIFVRSDGLESQLDQVLARIGTTAPESWFRLCTECNSPLKTVSREEVKLDPRFPEFVRSSHDPELALGWSCENCRKVFWRGSHYDRTRDFLGRIMTSGGSENRL